MLSDKQRAALIAAAKDSGVNPDDLFKEAESILSGGTDAATSDKSTAAKGGSKGSAPSGEPKPLYQYHLPFLTVNEVRMVWLGLDAMPGGDVNAAKYAAAQTGSSATQLVVAPTDTPTE